MPIIASAKKQLRQNKKRKSRNDNFKELYREARVAFEKAIKANDLAAAKSIYVNEKDADGKTKKAGLQSIIDKLVKKNIIHKNNAARKKAKFVKMLKSISQFLKLIALKENKKLLNEEIRAERVQLI